MLRMCGCMHSRFFENHPIWILEDGPLIFEVVLSQTGRMTSDDRCYCETCVTRAVSTSSQTMGCLTSASYCNYHPQWRWAF
jgi:hypothetical protein